MKKTNIVGTNFTYQIGDGSARVNFQNLERIYSVINVDCRMTTYYNSGYI